ncbi:MAG: hypothetical protein HC903_29860 [Methylacidiphilales bacterium]|nr:hypothetical protein [Candidatus Methylacidiphilales bacterium]
MKKYWILGLLIITVFITVACTDKISSGLAPQSNERVIDHAFGKVIIPKNPTRVVTLDPLSTETALALKVNLLAAPVGNSKRIGITTTGVIDIGIDPNLELLLKIKPDFDEVWTGKGALLSDEFNQYEEAIASFDKALKHNLDFSKAWLNRGITAGKSIGCDRFLAFSSPIAVKNPDLNQRGYEGQLVSYREGLKYCHQDTHPEGWGMLHQAIGNAHYSQGVVERNYRQYWLQAETEYKQALITLTKEAFPELHLDVLRDLIRVLFGLNKDEAAKEYRRQALEVFGQLLNFPNKSSFQKRKLQAQFSGFSQMRVDVLIEDGNFISALETAERNKNFYLTWILDARKEHILSPSYRETQKLINPQIEANTAIIYWHISPSPLLHLLSKPDADKPIVIPSQTQKKLEAWLKNWHTQYDNHRKGTTQQSSNPTWRDNLPQLLTQLGEILNIPAILESIQNQNTQIQNLILIPHRDLHRFPLHTQPFQREHLY